MNSEEKITIHSLNEKIRAGKRISMLSLYDYPFAVLAREAGIDSIIVGDSAAMNVYGYENTLAADMEMMIRHTQAVRRGYGEVFLIGDLPYLGSEPAVEIVVDSAKRFMFEGNADAVKIEGGSEVLPAIKAMIEASVPVVGHLGILPQTAAIAGSYKVLGREAESAVSLVEQARVLQQAGICMLILECVPPNVSQVIVKQSSVPVIGIGSGPACHGQVLVVYDILGLYPRPTAKFVRKFVDVKSPIVNGMKEYIAELSSGKYPAAEHCYPMKPGEEEVFKTMLPQD